MKAPEADLTKPTLSVAWVVGAFIGALLLFIVMGGAQWVYNMIKGKTASVTTKATSAVGGSSGTTSAGYYLA